MRVPIPRLAWAVQPLVIAFILWLGIGGPSRSLRTPIAWGSDASFYLMQARTTIDYGWWWTNPAISAPDGYPALLFPQNANVDQLFVLLAGLVSRDVLQAVNVAWFAMLMVSGLTSAWCFRRLGVSLAGAWVAGVLFAVCPFAIYRNIHHFSLMPYLVPFPAYAAVRLAAGPEVDWRWRGARGVLVGNVLLGLNATYYAYFGAFIVAAGALIGAARTKSTPPLRPGATALTVIIVATALNLAPSVLLWQRDGRPTGVLHLVSDAETYGLKIRHLLSPLPNHWFPPFRQWTEAEREAGFPVETENTFSRLGVVAAVGFAGLLGLLFAPSLAGRDSRADTLLALSRLTLAALLLAIIGGLGSLVSLLATADIRAYNRITVFIALFALAALALFIDRLRAGRTRTLVWTGVLVVGLADQVVAMRPLASRATEIAIDVRRVRILVGTLEANLPPDAIVFQLPLRPYPVDPGVRHLGVYDHLKPYLVSRTLRWSYPALSRDQIRRQEELERVPLDRLAAHLATLDVSAILVDRYGYDDEGASVVAALEASGGRRIAATQRYVAFDIRPIR